MKILILLFLASIACAYEPPYKINNIQDGKERFTKYAISENDKDEYRLLNNMVDKTSNQTITGNKTFSGTATLSSATITNLSITNINTGGKHWQIIASSRTTTNCSSLIIDGLNGDVDEEYKIIFQVAGAGANGVDNWLVMTISTATNLYDTTANYNDQYIKASGTAVSASNANSGGPGLYITETTNTGYISSGELIIHSLSGFRKLIYGTILENSTGSNVIIKTYSAEYKNSSANILGLKFICNNSDIPNGSYIEVWAKR